MPYNIRQEITVVQSADRIVKGSDLLVSVLENEGVEYIFGVPAEENVEVVESLRNSKIKLVQARHERAAAFMATTYGRLTGQLGVCIAASMYAALRYDDDQASMRFVSRSTDYNRPDHVSGTFERRFEEEGSRQ
ncbi:hypothetical protein JOH51_001645 [Rhizobium leguminosarum]|nr:thiamine pyrophosphate-binding protein [Rhizobium leguminosarum]MBP2444206.1 hypothetical protein [Rhizobium leguminosarum]